jgi:hypothetical protein
MEKITMPHETSSSAHLREIILDELEGDTGVIGPVEMTHGMVNRISIDNGSLTKLNSFYGKRCNPTHMFDICGSARTNGDGVSEIRLEDFVCLQEDVMVFPAFFVATPQTDSPVHLTFVMNAVDEDTGVTRIRIKVFAWNIGGEPVAKVSFHWQCCVSFVIGGID